MNSVTGSRVLSLVGHKDSYRLAQRPGSYVVLNYRRPVPGDLMRGRRKLAAQINDLIGETSNIVDLN